MVGVRQLESESGVHYNTKVSHWGGGVMLVLSGRQESFGSSDDKFCLVAVEFQGQIFSHA